MDWYELLGYVASILVAISLTQRSVLRLRIINLIGAVAFTVYGILINAYPVMLVNAIIVLINLYYLREMLTATEFFRVIEVSAKSTFLQAFLQHHEADIRRFYPSFSSNALQPDIALIVLRNMIPAGVYIGHRLNDDDLFVDVDYVTPQYRDFKTGQFIYDTNRALFDALGVRRILSKITPDVAYLRKMGFVDYVPTPDDAHPHHTSEALLMKSLDA